MLHKAYNKYQHLNWTNIVVVGEEKHQIELPDLPDNPKDIFFIDDNTGNAFWDRDRIISTDYKPIWFKFIPNETLLVHSDEIEEEGAEQKTEFDEDGYAVSLNKEDSDYIRFCYEREMNRRVHGVYFRNQDDITHLTGDHWFTLMWCKTKRPDKKGDYFDYREYQRDFFYEIKHTNRSPIITGAGWSKAKKTGITNLMWCYYLNKSTMTKNINLGHMNIDKDKGAKTFRDHFMYAYNGLVLALKPDFKSKSEADGIIVFGKRYNSKASKRNVDDDELNTTVMCVATALNAFDVDVFTDIWYDEYPKYKMDFGAIFRSNSGATKIQDFVVGKQWLTAYTPEQSGVSFTEAKKIFFNSELKTINPETGATKSGLICDHIAACKSWATSFNKFGKCDEAEARRKIQAELDSLMDRPQEFLKKRRELANTKKDAWSIADSSSLFDPIRLAELELDLEELQRSTQVFEAGELVWIDNPLWEVGKKDKRPKGTFGRVGFIPLLRDEIAKGKTGKIRIYEKMSPEEENFSLRFGTDQFGNLLPPSKFRHVGGIDPADFRDTGNAEEGSMIGMYSMKVHDPLVNTLMRRPATKIINAEYFGRPDNPEEWYQDIVKHIIYFGCLIVIEANNGTIATRLEDEGLGHYMLFKDKNGIFSFYEGEEKNRQGKEKTLFHITNQKSGRVDTVADIILYIKNYLLPGLVQFGEIDYGKTIMSERLIKQFKEFESDDTKKYDLVMSFGYTLMAHENYLALLSRPKGDEGYKYSEIATVMNALANHF
jgi:hypothetical protein